MVTSTPRWPLPSMPPRLSGTVEPITKEFRVIHSSDTARVGVVMGSDSDWPVMQDAAAALDEFGISYEVQVVSAHRMPHEMVNYGTSAADRGLSVVIAGAGGAAHLTGKIASTTPLPVIGVPVKLKALERSEEHTCELQSRGPL